MFLEQTSYLFVGSYFQALIVVMQMIYDVLPSTTLWPIYSLAMGVFDGWWKFAFDEVVLDGYPLVN